MRACLEQWPACTARITRWRAAAAGLLACQKRRKTTGRSPDTQAQGAPLLDPRPSSAVRQAVRASLDCARTTATPLGRAHLGVPLSAEAIASLCGMAKARGVGETPEAARLARRLPACCGGPTREEAEPVLKGSVAKHPERTAQGTSLTTQRREVLGHPERLERLSREPAIPPVARIPRPKQRANQEAIVNRSKGCKNQYGPQWAALDEPFLVENVAPPDSREAALAL